MHRTGANYIFKNNRLLVGCFEHENQKTEAWFALSFDGAGEITGRHLYTSANGSEQFTATMSQLHPALQAHFAGPNTTKAYFSMSDMEQLGFVTGQYYNVVRGRVKYCEREGGELKTMANGGLFPWLNASNAPQGQQQEGSQKRKRDSICLEGPAQDKKAKLAPGYFDNNNEDDDEELKPRMNIESTKTGAINQVPEAAIPDMQQPRPVQSQSQDQISAAIANLGMAGNVVPGVPKPAGQKHNILVGAKPNPLALTAVARNFKVTLLRHIDEWALSAVGLKNALTEPGGKLLTAFETGEILAASRNILQYMSNYCVHFRNRKLTQQHSLTGVRTIGLHADIIQIHDCLVKKYHEKETKLRAVVEEMKQRLEELQAASGLS